jgi:hypothetical protein
MTPFIILAGFRKQEYFCLTAVYLWNLIFCPAVSELTSLQRNRKATTVKLISRQQFQGYPKAGPRKNNKKKKAKGKTKIATDTPTNDEIE